MIERFCFGGLPRPRLAGSIGSKLFTTYHSASVRSSLLKPASKRQPWINAFVPRQSYPVFDRQDRLASRDAVGLEGGSPYSRYVERWNALFLELSYMVPHYDRGVFTDSLLFVPTVNSSNFRQAKAHLRPFPRARGRNDYAMRSVSMALSNHI